MMLAGSPTWDPRVDYDEAHGPRKPFKYRPQYGVWDDPTFVTVTIDECWMAEQQRKASKTRRLTPIVHGSTANRNFLRWLDTKEEARS